MPGVFGGDNRLVRAVAVVAIICALASLATIYFLTEQTPDATSAESSFVNDMLVGLFGWVPGLYDSETELWLGIHVRHWAHVVEFGVLGLFVTLAISLVRWKKPLVPTAAVSLLVCAACSLSDQCHKLLVPGRHFDWFDLAMDALGYGTAIALVIAIAALVMLKTTTHKG